MASPWLPRWGLTPLVTSHRFSPSLFLHQHVLTTIFPLVQLSYERETMRNITLTPMCSLCVKYVPRLRLSTSFSIAENIETQRMCRLHNEIPGHVKCQNYKILNIYSGHVLLS